MSDDAITEEARGAMEAIGLDPLGAREVVDAVRPLIEADLRERLAAAIEALEPPDLDGMDRYGAWFEATHDAARVTRERP